MIEESEFPSIMESVRTGDERAARRLVEAYEPEIRRYIRVRLTNPQVKRFVDSVDICQSVMANFFVLLSRGTHRFETPQQLARFLTVMAKHKIFGKSRSAARVPSLNPADGILDGLADRDGNHPFALAMLRELSEEMRSRLNPLESRIGMLRAEGKDWQEVADECRMSPDAARKRIDRALERILRELGLEP